MCMTDKVCTFLVICVIYQDISVNSSNEMISRR